MDRKKKIRQLSTKTGFFVDKNIEGMRNLLILTIITALMTGCFQGREAELGPEETLETFYRVLCTGDFDSAAALCDSLSMDGYIDGYGRTFMECDSTVRAIVADILSEMTVTVTDVEKSGDNRTVFYELTTTGGCCKEKVATLRKEEGAWKIEAITDRN